VVILVIILVIAEVAVVVIVVALVVVPVVTAYYISSSRLHYSHSNNSFVANEYSSTVCLKKNIPDIFSCNSLHVTEKVSNR